MKGRINAKIWELIYITQTEFGILYKEVNYESSLCLHRMIKTVTFKMNDNQTKLLIHHNSKRDSENPYQ